MAREIDGEQRRAYAMRRPDGTWPDAFDNGRPVPKRIRDMCPA
jgi:hypothetical protein